MTPCKSISIFSSNPDWNGKWTKEATEQRMTDIGLDPKEVSWVEFIIDMVFDEPADLDPYYDVIVDDRIHQIAFTTLNGIDVSIIKK